MYGAIEHYEACLKEGVKPIIGVEAYVAPRKHTDKDPRQDTQKLTNHLTLWAKNLTGYKNLVKLTTRAHLDGFYYRPRVDHELLAQHSEGIICGSACLGGEIPQFISKQKLGEAQERAEKYREIFGKENFFLELMDHDLTGQDEVNSRIIDIHHKTGIPLIATNDAHYSRATDEQMHKVLVCIGTNSTLDSSSLHYGPNFYLKSKDEMWDRFKHVPEAMENTMRIADMVDLELDLKSTHFPHFDVPAGHDLISFLKFLCNQRFDARYPAGHTRRDEAVTRMEYELGIIISKGYAGYFLVVQDFINWSKERGIMVGCRGSAAGCLVSYVLGITNLDPLPYGLLFERFLNPDRQSTPDIDVDFPDKRRDEVMGYVTKKYGKDKVAQIITFGTLAARAAVRDTARVMGLDLKIADNVAKLIPAVPGHPVSIMEAVEQVHELGELYNNDSQTKELLDNARQIEGFTRHASRHACGVVIGKESLDELVPLQEKDGDIITQYGASSVEKVGLVKMDFLGLQNNTVINDTLELIEARHGTKIDLETIDTTDKKVYDMLGRGDGIAVFQMEGVGMRNLLREMKPENLEHIIAQISLYRPGPMDEIPRYITGRHGGPVTYLHPKLEPILKDTYGMLLYQEQVMQASQVLAGFTGGQAETLMKAMSKKKADDMAKMKPLFLKGCAQNAISQNDASEIFARMEAFAAYAFNKSHAAYYGLVAYWTAFLKINYTPEFMACKMTSLLGDKAKLLIVIDDCRKHGVDVLPPDVNESNHEFTVTDEGIRFGLQAIKGIGEAPVDAICEGRRENGRFSSLFDFCGRVSGRACSRGCLETLIKCGVFDTLHTNRQAMLDALPAAMEQGALAAQDAESGQMNLLGEAEEVGRPKATGTLPDVPDADTDIRLGWEKEYLGLYVSDHPLLPLRNYLEKNATPIEQLGADRSYSDGSRVTCGGMITQMQRRSDKNGQPWAILTLEDLSGSMEVLVFAKTYARVNDCIEEDAKLLITGRLSADQRGGRGRNAGGGEEENAAGEENVIYKIMADSMDRIPNSARDEEPVSEELLQSTAAGSSTPPQSSTPSPDFASSGISVHRSQAPAPITPAAMNNHANSNGHTNGSEYTNGNGYANGNGHTNGNGHANGSGTNGHSVNDYNEAPKVQSLRAIGREFTPPASSSHCVHMHIPEDCATAEKLGRLWNICKLYPGETEVWLHIDNGVEMMQLRASHAYWVNASAEFCNQVVGELGEGRLLVPQPM